MSRPADSIGFGRSFPPVGQHKCVVTGVKNAESKNKKTPYLEIEWLAETGECFTDSLFTTPGAIGRLNMFALRVCGMPRDTQLPDDDLDAVNDLEAYIEKNAVGKSAIVTVEEQDYEYIEEKGPDIGMKKTKKTKRVAFRGYEEIDKEKTISPVSLTKEKEDLPF